VRDHANHDRCYGCSDQTEEHCAGRGGVSYHYRFISGGSPKGTFAARARCSPYRLQRTLVTSRWSNGEPHLMTANGAPVEANSCVASLGEPLDAGDFHHLAAAARRPLSGARN
jgi:hypothetical protein